MHVGLLRLDALSEVFLLSTALVYALAGVHSVGYLAAEADAPDYPRYARLYHTGLNVFCWAMLVAPAVDGLALLWVAIEVTTVVSALLVAIDGTERSTEAAWKYVLIASVGLGLALLATIFMYYAGSRVLGTGFDLSFSPLQRVAHELPATPVRLAFVCAVVGFGTKVGLVPMHTWLPDAHAEAPTPVSALLSGALLADSFYAVLRYFQVTSGAAGAAFPRAVLLGFGIASLGLAALYVLDQTDVKRLLAYSSVEHMGILAIGASIGSTVALAGVLLHVLAHAAAKGGAFLGAGGLVRAFATKDLRGIRSTLERVPFTGTLFVLAILGLSAVPPSGMFRSEFQIVQGGLASGTGAPAGVLVGLATLAFLGLGVAATRTLLPPAAGQGGPQPDLPPPDRAASGWMAAATLAGLAALVVLGVHPPGALTAVLHAGAASLAGGR